MYKEVLSKIFFGAKWDNLTYEDLVKNKFLIVRALVSYVEESHDRNVVPGFKVPSPVMESELWSIFLTSVNKEYTRDQIEYDKFKVAEDLCNYFRAWRLDMGEKDLVFLDYLSDFQVVRRRLQQFLQGSDSTFHVNINQIVFVLDLINQFNKGLQDNLIREDKWYYPDEEFLTGLVECQSYFTKQLTL